jgi:trk system potassium uptake protein
MKIIIIGCGRMGSGLARTLSLRGHTVTVVDREKGNFERLGAGFKGQSIVGVGFDRDVLMAAGIQRADALAAVTPIDEENIVSARLASQVFRVPCVVARTYDPRKAEIYRRLGLRTIDPIAWGVNRVAELLCSTQLDIVATLGGGNVDIVEIDAPPLLVGRQVKDLMVPGEIHIVAISRGGKTFLPTLGTQFAAGDLVHLAIVPASAGRLKAMLGMA